MRAEVAVRATTEGIEVTIEVCTIITADRESLTGFFGIIEEREQPVVIVMRDGVVLVSMTADAADGQPQPEPPLGSCQWFWSCTKC